MSAFVNEFDEEKDAEDFLAAGQFGRFVESDDGDDEAEVSLRDLGEAYAALLRGEMPGAGERAATADSDAGPSPADQAASGGVPAIQPGPPLAEEAAGDEDERTDEGEISPRAIIEAMLFVGDPENRPLAARKIASLLRGVSPREVNQCVTELNQRYEEDETPYRIAGDAAGYRLRLTGKFEDLAKAFHGRMREARLSQAAIDVLSLVAYRQPITRQEVDKLRGSPSGGILNQLVRRRLLALDRSSGETRRPQFRTTDRFLDLFSLEELADLPQAQEE